MSHRPIRIFLCAGEPSGDTHGALLARALIKQNPDVQLEGLGGPKMVAAGVDMPFNFVKHAVMGFFRVIPKAYWFRWVRKRLVDRLEKDPPDIIVPIDFPGFNLRFAKDARPLGIPTCFYVSPQLWAWYPSRIHKIRRRIDHMMVLFPFEVPIYEKGGVPVTYVGHPMYSKLNQWEPDPQFKPSLNLPDNAWVVALMPGSRDHEVARNLPIQLKAAAQLSDVTDRPLRFLLPYPDPKLKPIIESILEKFLHKGPQLDVQVIDGRFDDVAHISRLAIVCSGTATLQTAFHQIPMVVQYRVSPIEYFFQSIFRICTHFALANVVAEELVVPEFLIWRDTHQPIADAAKEIIVDGPAREACLAGLARIKEKIVIDDAPGRAAKVVHEIASK